MEWKQVLESPGKAGGCSATVVKIEDGSFDVLEECERMVWNQPNRTAMKELFTRQNNDEGTTTPPPPGLRALAEEDFWPFCKKVRDARARRDYPTWGVCRDVLLLCTSIPWHLVHNDKMQSDQEEIKRILGVVKDRLV